MLGITDSRFQKNGYSPLNSYMTLQKKRVVAELWTCPRNLWISPKIEFVWQGSLWPKSTALMKLDYFRILHPPRPSWMRKKYLIKSWAGQVACFYVLLCKYSLHTMLQTGGNRITMCSLYGLMNHLSAVWYQSTKAWFTRSLLIGSTIMVVLWNSRPYNGVLSGMHDVVPWTAHSEKSIRVKKV